MTTTSAVHSSTDQLTEPPKVTKRLDMSLIRILLILGLLVVAAVPLLSLVMKVRPVPASDLDPSDCPFGETGAQAWGKRNRHAVGGTTYGYKVPDTQSFSTFLRHRSLEPDRVLCIFDLNYAGGVPGPSPTKPFNLLITLGVPWRNSVGTMLSEPGSRPPFGIVLTGAAADEFMKNGPTQDQIDELLSRSPR